MKIIDKRVLRQLAAIIESFGLGCVVVNNPFRAEKGPTHCFIITQPDFPEDTLTEEELNEQFQKARNSCQKIIVDFDYPIILGCFNLGPTVSIASLTDWLQSLDDDKKHPILSGDPFFGSTDIFLSKVIYGHKVHQLIVEVFLRRYGSGFIKDCFRVYVKHLEEKKKRLKDFNRELAREIEERKKPLNYYEVREIKYFLRNCIKTVKKIKPLAIVGLDCSGRPLAEMLWQLLKEIGYSPLPLLEFLDPHQLRDNLIWISHDKPKVPNIFVEILKEEFPQLYKFLQQDVQRILFLDDQIFSYGNTINAVSQLIKQTTKREDIEIPFLIVSGFDGYNAFTWWKNKSLLRVKNNKDCGKITLKALLRVMSDGEEARIVNFERELQKIVEGVLVSLKSI